MPLRNKILWEGGIFASIPKSEYSLSNESVDYGIMIKERKKHVKKRKNIMDVNFEYYKIFYYVAKYHNFTKAAQALNNSQPNITRAMNCLEQQLNTTLFIRTNRGVQLTPEGERLYTHVLSAMEQFQAAEEELADSSGLSHGSVAIGASETALNIFLLDKLKSFHMTYPGIRLKLYNHSTPEARNFPFGR